MELKNYYLWIVVGIIGLFILFRGCVTESRWQKVAIKYMKENVFKDGTYVAGYDMGDLEDDIEDMGAPKFKRGQHAVSIVVDLYGMKQEYVLWMQDKKVFHYEMAGSVTVGKIENYIYPKLYEQGWRK